MRMTQDNEDDSVPPTPHCHGTMTATTAIAPPTTTASDCSWGGDGKQLGRDDDRPDPSAMSNCLLGGWLVRQTRRYDTGNSEDRDDSDQNDDKRTITNWMKMGQ